MTSTGSLPLTIQALPMPFSVCKLAEVDGIALNHEFFFFSKTDAEISLVCPSYDVPGNVLAREDGWRAFRVVGVLDFSLIGILARIAQSLADEGISIFALSTYDTDYVLVKEARSADAVDALRRAGFSTV